MTLIRCGRCDEKTPSPELVPCQVCFLPTCGKCAPEHLKDEHKQVELRDVNMLKPQPKKGKKSDELGSLADA